MPIYEYQCSECQHITEELRSFSDESLNESRSACPNCNTVMSKVVSAVHGLVKGSKTPVKMSQHRLQGK